MTKKPICECFNAVSLARFGLAIALAYFAAAAYAQVASQSARATGRQQLQGHVRAAMNSAPLVGDLQPDAQLNIAISLPLRNQDDLNKLLKDLYDPQSREYRHFLSPEEVTDRFGPTVQDYQAVVDFAKANGLSVTSTYANRLVVSLAGKVGDIQNALHTNLHTRKRPDESIFYAPDREPSIDLDVPVLHISGLENYVLPHPNVSLARPGPSAAAKLADHEQSANPTPALGSGPFGLYGGNDFRAAYVPGTTLTGAGQCVGLVEFDSFYLNDVLSYEKGFKLPNVPVQTILLDGVSGSPDGNLEVPVDIEMAIAMAPGLSSVAVYEGLHIDTILNSMASRPFCQQLSASWLINTDSGTLGILKTMAMQGQSLFAASGDAGAYPADPSDLRDQPYVTIVGATELGMNGSGASWQSESAASFSGGGVATSAPLPDYQQRIWLPDGSYSSRNLPDVAIVGDGVVDYHNNGSYDGVRGASISSPLWAGFMALVNQQRAVNGELPLGFANPPLYSLASGANYDGGPHTGTNYGIDFHDIVAGSNPGSPGDPNEYYARIGYDLVTGWGSPTGHLINDLATPLPPSQVPGCQLTFACPYAVTAPPNFTVQCPFRTDFYSISPAGTSTFIGTDTQVTGTSSDYDVHVRACYPGSSDCTAFEVGTSPQQWCKAPPPPPPPGCGQKGGCGKCPGGICQ